MRDPTATADPFALLAGTLCLMSCPNAGRAPLYLRRIVCNLECLSEHPAVTGEMRTVCRRLAQQWERQLVNVETGHGPAPVH